MNALLHINKNRCNTKQEYFKYYTILFIIVVLLIFSWFFLTGTSFIWEEDGWTQHYKALVYYSKYLRQIFHGILYKHQLIIPTWDFNIGEGSDILATLHYYVIGDPFAILSAFVPSSYMYIYYQTMIVLRIYLAGIVFSYFSFKTGRINYYAVMAGSLTYVFCYWIMINAITHPYFLNPMIYLPLLLTGIEKLLKKERPYLFILSVFLSAVSNFYFFYMLVLLTIIYVVIRLCILYKTNFRKWLSALWRITTAAVAGVSIAAIILLPVCYIFLSDNRMSLENAHPIIYQLSYYGQLPVLFITSNQIYWMAMGYASPVLLAVFLLFYKRKKYFLTKALFITGIVIMLIPFLGQILNGFSYVTNRWSFAFAFICAYILTLMWPHFMCLKPKETKILVICTTFYFIICMAICLISDNTSKNVCVSILIAYIFLLAIRKEKQKVAIALIISSIFCNSYFAYIYTGAIFERKKTDEISTLTQNETQTVLNAARLDNTNSFFRYSGEDLTENANIIAGLSSTQYYWSLTNPNIIKFQEELELYEKMAYRYNGYNDRTALMSLASVLYYIQPTGQKVSVPYGFEQIKDASNSDYNIYKNKYTLPLGYTYKNYIPKSKWDKLYTAQKQEALLQSVVIDNYNGNAPVAAVKNLSKEIAYKTICKNNNVTINNNSFVVTSNRAKIKFKFKGLNNSETYFCIKGLDLQGNSTKTEKLMHGDISLAKIKLESSEGTVKKLEYRTKESHHYDNRHDYMINLGYSKKPAKWLTITFPVAGTYSFDSIGITCTSMNGYEDKISKLKEDVLENIKIETDCVSGNISLDISKLLCLPIPYSVGWEAFVDGKKTDLYKANIMYMALDLSAGNHDIVLKYHTPLLKIGTCISVISILLVGIWVLISERKRKIVIE